MKKYVREQWEREVCRFVYARVSHFTDAKSHTGLSFMRLDALRRKLVKEVKKKRERERGETVELNVVLSHAPSCTAADWKNAKRQTKKKQRKNDETTLTLAPHFFLKEVGCSCLIS